MKTKLVLWGTNANDERTLIAMELRPELNQVGMWMFPESIATDEFAKQLFDEWRESKEVPFPEGFTYREQELTMTESLLPDDIKVERSDIVQRAQAEWHFIVLSSKLQEAYHSELEELKDRVERLESFDPAVWENLKGFWDKVQNQVRERNLFRDHIESLRENTNALFEHLKELRKKMDDEFSKQSRETMQKFMASLEEVEQKVKEGLRLQSAFDELKKVQREYRDAQMTRDHRSKVWDRLDGMFKAVKEKRFGGETGKEDSPLLRIQRRYNGLLEAIQKMERSVKRDKDDLNFQAKKIATTDGQLEAQIRQAKITMIEERIRSKEDKLNEMVHTRTDLEGRMERIRQRQAKEQEKEKLEEAKEHAKEKIAEQIKQQQAEMEEISDKLEKAAESITGEETPEAATEEAVNTETEAKAEEETETAAEPEPSLLEKVEDAFEDAVDTVKAIAEVAEEKIEDALEKAEDKIEDVVDQAEDKVEDVVEKVKAKRKKKAAPKSVGEEPSLLEKVGDAVEKAVDTVKEMAEDAADRAEEIVEKLTGDDDDDDDDDKKGEA